MSLKSFQLALADIIASPRTGKAYLNDPALLDQKYTLTETERNRLLYMLQQKGMRINYMLYQTNRMTPLSIFMPYTLKILRPQLLAIVQEFWVTYPKTPFQFKEELGLFSSFLKTKISQGLLDVPYLEDLILLEDSLNDIRFGDGAGIATAEDTSYALHPAVRIIHTEYNPALLAEAMVTYNASAPMPVIPPAASPFLMKYISRLELYPVDLAIASSFEEGRPVPAVSKDLIDLGFVLCKASGDAS
jgi:hypothetical protein